MYILQMANLNETIKAIALKTIEESKPCNIIYGEVVTIDPLSINIEQKMILPSEFFILTNNVKDHIETVTINWSTESSDGHTHNITGVKTITVNNALKKGEKVILLRYQGGQDYLVLDRM